MAVGFYLPKEESLVRFGLCLICQLRCLVSKRSQDSLFYENFLAIRVALTISTGVYTC